MSSTNVKLGKVAAAVLAHMKRLEGDKYHTGEFLPGCKRDENAAESLVSAGLATCDVREVTVKFATGSLTQKNRYYRLTSKGQQS